MAQTTRHLTFRVPTAIAAKIETLADSENLGMSQYLRKIVESALSQNSDNSRLDALEARLQKSIESSEKRLIDFFNQPEA